MYHHRLLLVSMANDSGGAPVVVPDDGSVIEALRRGDETAFARLVDHYHASLGRVARLSRKADAVLSPPLASRTPACRASRAPQCATTGRVMSRSSSKLVMCCSSHSSSFVGHSEVTSLALAQERPTTCTSWGLHKRSALVSASLVFRLMTPMSSFHELTKDLAPSSWSIVANS
jgi:hypothetical protein